VHLDFARGSVRLRQLQELAQVIASRNRPCIVMGDFNMPPNASQMEPLATLGLTTHLPDAPLVTFPKLGQRLDAIFHSPQLRMTDHEVLHDAISDHRGVVATFGWS
jgi:endonuclease/exonuclease/phosphatase (EEP) superfamily protein YafD